ncbi:hypothetical protein BDK51DRAFT_25466 [Blyttiomyces helicus]|uniref:Uncharacterized protein n=1 Tax=Blyttiomyces helicus TaxID=388810 RepID=A0A4P9WPQ0_9FUNG|nr:hypothetical protein BDK51DRAFT_25466 [Blyttiomyces helicus]|eukprot:RKO93240.1 hypothetical protein BDK51DRAFT_25466 [Blyttiomyces helicus]
MGYNQLIEAGLEILPLDADSSPDEAPTQKKETEGIAPPPQRPHQQLMGYDSFPPEAKAKIANTYSTPDQEACAPLDREPLDGLSSSLAIPSDDDISLNDNNNENTPMNMVKAGADDKPRDDKAIQNHNSYELPPHESSTCGHFEYEPQGWGQKFPVDGRAKTYSIVLGFQA